MPSIDTLPFLLKQLRLPAIASHWQETSVLFELIAHRYEDNSLLITANQPFGDWNDLFPNKIMAVAAIDRIVHHATIIKIEDESYRAAVAMKRHVNLTSGGLNN